MTYFVTLTAQDGADIYYEIAEGADKAAVPTTASKKFDTYQYRQIEITQPTASAKGPVTKTYNLQFVVRDAGNIVVPVRYTAGPAVFHRDCLNVIGLGLSLIHI